LKDKYLDLYDYWKCRVLKEGFSNNQFNEQLHRFVDLSEADEMTKAVGAKITYITLLKERREFNKVQYEIEHSYCDI
jgi:hypothetical protein